MYTHKKSTVQTNQLQVIPNASVYYVRQILKLQMQVNQKSILKA